MSLPNKGCSLTDIKPNILKIIVNVNIHKLYISNGVYPTLFLSSNLAQEKNLKIIF